MKCCAICKIEKEYDCFHKKSTSKDGYRSQCKECRKEKEKYSLKPEKIEINLCDKKICITCNLEKKIEDFQPRKDSSDGYRGDCRDCRSEYLKSYKTENEEKLKRKRKEYYEDNKEVILLKNREYHKINPRKYKPIPYTEKRKLYNKLYRKENKERLNLSNNSYRNNRRKVDLTYKLYESMRNMITRSVKSKKFHKSSNTRIILGCDAVYLRDYLESKFESWMTWENYGLYNGELNYGWDIDHIVPLSSANSIEELNLLNHYTNLQPLCSKINRDIKKDKMDFISILS